MATFHGTNYLLRTKCWTYTFVEEREPRNVKEKMWLKWKETFKNGEWIGVSDYAREKENNEKLEVLINNLNS